MTVMNGDSELPAHVICEKKILGIAGFERQHCRAMFEESLIEGGRWFDDPKRLLAQWKQHQISKAVFFFFSSSSSQLPFSTLNSPCVGFRVRRRAVGIV